MIDAGDYNVKKVKRYESATAYKGSRKIADLEWQDGGIFNVWWKSDEEKDIFESWLLVLQENNPDNETYEDEEIFFDELMHERANVDQAKRNRKTKTYYLLKGDDEARNKTIPYSENVANFIIREHGENLNYIVNEEFYIYPDDMEKVVR